MSTQPKSGYSIPRLQVLEPRSQLKLFVVSFDDSNSKFTAPSFDECNSIRAAIAVPQGSYQGIALAMPLRGTFKAPLGAARAQELGPTQKCLYSLSIPAIPIRRPNRTRIQPAKADTRKEFEKGE